MTKFFILAAKIITFHKITRKFMILKSLKIELLNLLSVLLAILVTKLIWCHNWPINIIYCHEIMISQYSKNLVKIKSHNLAYYYANNSSNSNDIVSIFIAELKYIYKFSWVIFWNTEILKQTSNSNSNHKPNKTLYKANHTKSEIWMNSQFRCKFP